MNFIEKMVGQFVKLNQKMKRWKRAVSILSAVVVFATTYALVLPAITLDKDTASEQPGIEVAASENEPSMDGTVFESEPEEEETEPVDEEEEENSGADSASQDAEAAEEEEDDAPSEDAVVSDASGETEENDASEADTVEDASSESEEGTPDEEEPEQTEADAEEETALTEEVNTEIELITEKTQLIYEGSDYIVYADFDAEAKLPVGVELKVKEITEKNDPEAYEEYYNKALSEMQDKYDENTRLSFARFYDISFVFEGNEVEPSGDVKVRIEYKKAIDLAKDTNVDAIHFDKNDDEKAEVIDSQIDSENNRKSETETVKAVEFESDQFSVYGIVGTGTITTQFIDHKGTRYEVTVTYGPDANIPDGSWLRVTEIDEGTEEYDAARNAVLADKKEKNEFVDIDDFNLAALDISIIDPNGQEIEPEAAVTVDIKIKDLPEVEDLEDIKDTLEVQHHVEVSDGVVIEKVFDGSVEGSYEMDTDENIAKQGTAVDPNSVSDEDFRNSEFQQEVGIHTSFNTDAFSTFTITWRNGGRTVTVHYVDESGNELTIVNPDDTHPNMNGGSSSPAFLIYDIDGYEYSYTYRNTDSASNRIMPVLEKGHNNNSYWYYTTSTASEPTYQELSNGDNIYVVYTKKTDPTPGGTAVIDDANPDDWPQDPATPRFSKSSIHNDNGTNTVSLSITGGEKEYEKSTKANVIVVFDRSGSMGGNNIWRLNTAKQAVNDMANTLLNGDISGVKMALVSFSNDASVVQGFTDNYSTYTSAVNGLTANGGTNWEQSLAVANRMAVDSDAATFIVFVTDGDPTFRMSRGDKTNNELDMLTATGNNYRDYWDYRYYRLYHVFGTGTSDDFGYNFDYAAEEVTSILNSNKTFYAIGVSTDVTKVQNLVDEAGGGTAYLATDSAALEEAFATITQSIKTELGFGDVAITDGITELSNVEMKVMQEVDPDSFTYYKITSSGQTEWDPASEGAGLANYDKTTGAVTWNMGEGFQLEDGVTYMVTFRVWPSQEAYDLIADLNNGVKVYASGQTNSITDEEREQVVELKAPTETDQGSYTLKTNTDTLNATYSQTSSTGETVTVSGETGLEATYIPGTIENMPLESVKLTIKKEFEDSLVNIDPITGLPEDRQPEVVLVLKRRNGHQANESSDPFEDYAVPQGSTTSANIVLNDDNNWTYSVYVAPGFEVDGEVLEHGYDFTVTEPEIDYHYGLIEEIINPMVVDGHDKYYGDGYLLEDDETIQQYVDQSLTAVNRVKSGIDIKKLVYDVDGATEIHPDTKFTITGFLLDKDGNPYTWAEGDDENASGAYHKFTPVLDENGNYTYDEETGEIIYERTVYKGHFASTGEITLELSAGEWVRFINVPEGSTFEFTESTTGMADQGYEWKSTDAVTRHKEESDGPFVSDGDVQPVVSEQTVSLETGVVGNKQYSITYGNKRTIELPEVELIKVDQDDPDLHLNDAGFELHKDSATGDLVTTDGNGKEIAIITTNREGSEGPDGWYNIGLLPAGTYYLVETTEPEGYLFDDTPVIITVTKGTDSYTVTATKNGESVISFDEETGIYTITVDNAINSTEADATKAWKNADGSTTPPEGATVVFTLYADGEATDYKVTLDGTADTAPTGTGGYESEAWKASFVNLTKYKEVDGEAVEIVYTIAETTTYPGYTASTTDPVASGETITNEQEPTDANAIKAWKNADGSTTPPEGATVVFTLYADGTATNYTVTLDGTADTEPAVTGGYESEAWKASYVKLPKYKIVDGEAVEIVYTVAETTTYPGYTASTTEPVASGETITNEQEPTDANAIKEWKNADGSTTPPEGATVVFTLYADGTATNYAVTLDGTEDTKPTGTSGYESPEWTASFINLPKYKIEDGKAVEIVYTVAETTTYPGYTASTTDPVESGSTITNKQDPTSADATKEWKNADGTTTAPEGATVVFTLYADGTATEYTVTLDGAADAEPTGTSGYESEGWKASFVNLPKYKIVDGEAVEIVYTIAETTTYPGYKASTTDPVASGGTITNEQEPTDANAIKEWENADGSTTPPEGATVVFTLYADGTATNYAVTLDGTEDAEPTGTGGYESPAWTASFVNLPKYKIVDGEAVEIEYTIAETTTYPGYTASTTDPVESGETITNTQGSTGIYADKVWKNADGSTTPPEGATVVFTLYADGTATNYKVTLDGTVDTAITGTGGYESEAWRAEFVNLPQYRIEDGKEVEIVYTIAETTGYPGYTADTTDPVGSGSKITNSQDPTDANALKAWVNADGTTTAPQGGQVTYTLYADGEPTQYTVTLDGTADTEPTVTGGYESEAWKAMFVQLPKYKIVDGEAVEIVYTIAETTTYPGYTASTTEPVASGETITNTQDPTDASAIKEWKNADGSTTPPEGATVVFTLYADGTATEYTVTLDGTAEGKPTGTNGYESEAWKASFVNLPKYKVVDGAAVEIVYTVAETTTYPGYKASTTDPVASGETITNEQEPTDVNAIKEWKNADGSTTPPEGATVVFTLYADGTATDYTVTLDGTADTEPAVTGGYESEAWKASYVKLPKYKIVDGEAVEIVYTVAETTTYPGYTASTTEPVASGETITNEQEPTDANALKEWKNADGSTTPPEGATVAFTLYADGEATNYTVLLDGTVDETVPTVTGGYEGEAWKAMFVQLPKYKIVDGAAVEIVYTIAETGQYSGYTASTTEPVASGGTIINEQEPTDANAIKEWKNADGSTTPPEGATVVFTLYADGTATEYTVELDGTVDETVPTVTGGYEGEAWKAMFVQLPKYKVVEDEAVEIVYTIAETTTYPGYTASTTEPVASGETITNEQEPTDANAIKEWKNADGSTTPPEGATVVFTLYADGTATEYTVELDGTADETVPTVTGGYESEAWKATFVQLPKYQADGTTEIVYTVAETTGYTGYKASTTEPVASGETITNSQLSAVIKLLKIGDADTSNTLDGVQFELYSVWNGPKATDNVKAVDISGKEVGTITTSGGGKATVGGLLPGTYYLIETKGADGYRILTSPVEIYIQLIDEEPGYTVSYNQTDYSASQEAGNLTPDTDGAYEIVVSNPSGEELPMTGGPGNLLYTLSGLALVFASALMCGFRMRRRERGVF